MFLRVMRYVTALSDGYTYDDGMSEIENGLTGLRIGGLGSAFKPYVKRNAKSKEVVNTAFASIVAEREDPIVVVPTTVVPAAVALAGNNQALSAVTADSVLTSGPAISLDF